MENFDAILIQNENLQEAFLSENFNGTWTPKQLLIFEKEFNNLPKEAEHRRQILLNRFFHAMCISSILINKLKFVSENALHIDSFHLQFNELRRAELTSKHLSQFNNLHFGPVRKMKKEPKHDAHIKAYLYYKIPPPYQKKYEEEPKLIGSIELIEEKDVYQITIAHLVKTKSFCNCINLQHRETMYTIPLTKIISINLQPNIEESFNLHLEIEK